VLTGIVGGMTAGDGEVQEAQKNAISAKATDGRLHCSNRSIIVYLHEPGDLQSSL
jgi:hypothetical protein